MITKEDFPQLQKLFNQAGEIYFFIGFVLGVIVTSIVAWMIP